MSRHRHKSFLPHQSGGSRRIKIPYGDILTFCQRWHIVRLALFGSFLRSDFRHDSDIDILATFAPDSQHTLLDLVQMETELGRILGRRVDLGEYEAVKADTNPVRRQSILSTQQVLYQAHDGVRSAPPDGLT